MGKQRRLRQQAKVTITSTPEIRADIRVWRVLNGKKFLCNDSDLLRDLEYALDFSEEIFWSQYPKPLSNGYYYVAHRDQRGNYFAGKFEKLVERLNTMYPVDIIPSQPPQLLYNPTAH